jgi:hypothetical protein
MYKAGISTTTNSIKTARKLATNRWDTFDLVAASVTYSCRFLAGTLSFFQHARKYSSEESLAAIYRRA